MRNQSNSFPRLATGHVFWLATEQYRASSTIGLSKNHNRLLRVVGADPADIVARFREESDLRLRLVCHGIRPVVLHRALSVLLRNLPALPPDGIAMRVLKQICRKAYVLRETSVSDDGGFESKQTTYRSLSENGDFLALKSATACLRPTSL